MSNAPLSPHPNGQSGWVRNYRPYKGAPRNAAERLNLAIPHWNPPKFGGFLPNSLIFFAPDAPFPQHPNGKGGGMRNYRPKQSDAAEHHGTPRNATEPDGAPKFGYSALGSAIVWRISPELSNIYAPKNPFFPTPKWRRRRNAKLPTKQRGANHSVARFSGRLRPPVFCKTRKAAASRNYPGWLGDGGRAESGNNYIPRVAHSGKIRPGGIEPPIYGLLERRSGR